MLNNTSVSAYTFLSPVASSILAPSLEQIADDLNIKSDSERSLCLSIFVLGFAFGPLILSPISEIYGRAVVLQWTNVFFLIFNLACGFAQSSTQLIIFRLLAGIGGSAPMGIGPGVLSDLFSADQRGLSAGIYSMFPLMGPAIGNFGLSIDFVIANKYTGPLCGGFITEYSTWRWGFWATSICDFPILILCTIFLEETYPSVLLQRKKEKLIQETGNESLYTARDRSLPTFSKMLQQALTRPVRLMTTQIIIIVMGLYQAYLYGLMYFVLTTYPKLWTEGYNQRPSVAGLNYISLGIGYSAGIQVSVLINNRTGQHPAQSIH
jgi:MFS family permease